MQRVEGQDEWRVGETTFVWGFDQESTPDRFYIRKPSSLMALYESVAREFQRGTIVELGIAAGGSTALLALLMDPRRLISCELDPRPVEALATFIAQRGLDAIVRPNYGVDQADRSGLAAIVDAERDGAPLDLVIDDASHLYEPTKASFEVLFPRLRPGGLLIVEDWSADYKYARRIRAAMTGTSADDKTQAEARIADQLREAPRPPRPLPAIAVELLHIAATSDQIVRRLEVNKHWLVVERGAARLDEGAFRLVDHYDDPWRWLSAPGPLAGRARTDET